MALIDCLPIDLRKVPDRELADAVEALVDEWVARGGGVLVKDDYVRAVPPGG